MQGWKQRIFPVESNSIHFKKDLKYEQAWSHKRPFSLPVFFPCNAQRGHAWGHSEWAVLLHDLEGNSWTVLSYSPIIKFWSLNFPTFSFPHEDINDSISGCFWEPNEQFITILEHTSCNQTHKQVRCIRWTEKDYILCPYQHSLSWPRGEI